MIVIGGWGYGNQKPITIMEISGLVVAGLSAPAAMIAGWSSHRRR
jgi:hypothetical protein